MSENLKESTAKNFFWAALSNGTQQVVMLLVGILLARRLEVSDYAMVAMLTVFSALAQNLQDSGFATALCNKCDAEHRDFNAVFWLSICISVVVYTTLFSCAPLIASFNHTPELVLVARIIFLGFVVTSLNTAHWAYLYKHLMVRERTISQVSSSLISSAIGLIAAYAGAGYWSLVAMDLGYKISISIFYWHFSPWRPTFEFNLRPAFELFRFSSKILITNLLTTLNGQVLQALMGHFFPRKDVVGHYSQANKWSLMGTNMLSGMITNVVQPVLVTVTDDADRQVRVFRKMLRFTSFLAFPALWGLGMIAPEFIPLTIGDKWNPCVPLLQIICFAAPFLPLGQLFAQMLISKGKSTRYMLITSTFLLLQLSVVIALHPYGVDRMLYAIALLNMTWLFVWWSGVRGLIRFPLTKVLQDVFPFFCLALLTTLSANYIGNLIPDMFLRLVVKIIIAAAHYWVWMHILKPVVYLECVAFFKCDPRDRHAPKLPSSAQKR